jgi:outer membrane protein OmpA-like peptidoglycan-associated protein
MRMKGPLACLLFFGLALATARGQAQIDAERMKPAVTPDGWVNAEGSGTRHPADPWEFGAFVNYGYRLIDTALIDGVDRSYLSGRLGLDLLASYAVSDAFTVGLALPAYATQTGHDDPTFAGLGDLRLVPKLRLLDSRSTLGLALAAEVRAPTHTGDFAGGTRGVVVAPKVIADSFFTHGLRLGLNLGALLRERTSFGGLDTGNEFTYSLAGSYRRGGREGTTELGLELNGAVGLNTKDASPLEAFLFARHALTRELEVIGGPSFGLVRDSGVPMLRAFVGLRYRPTVKDRDFDGIPDHLDQCPGLPEDYDGFEDDDGCPEEGPDADGDGVPDYLDRCPFEKETINGIDDDDGCPDEGLQSVVFEDGEFRILEAVKFEHGSARIARESYSLLDQIALTIRANPQLKRIIVAGHTDDTGPRAVNKHLSQRRAAAVVRYLASKGVSQKRLRAVGYGAERPLVAEPSNDEERAKNRRVEFLVAD